MNISMGADTLNISFTQAGFDFILILISFIIVYLIFIKVLSYLKDKIPVDANEFFPEEENRTLKQVFYLIVASACFIYILSSFILIDTNNFYFSLFDFILSTYCFLTFRNDTWKDKVLLFFLIPFGSIDFLIMNTYTLLGVLDFAHIIAFVFVIRDYYRKFMHYTRSHGLGIAILLLYFIVFLSTIFTAFSENVNLLDALVMSSNAFTSNGYAVLGNTIPGKINAIILVWSGYLISGVSVATLTTALLMKHFNKRFDKLEELINKNNEEQ